MKRFPQSERVVNSQNGFLLKQPDRCWRAKGKPSFAARVKHSVAICCSRGLAGRPLCQAVCKVKKTSLKFNSLSAGRKRVCTGSGMHPRYSKYRQRM